MRSRLWVTSRINQDLADDSDTLAAPHKEKTTPSEATSHRDTPPSHEV